MYVWFCVLLVLALLALVYGSVAALVKMRLDWLGVSTMRTAKSTSYTPVMRLTDVVTAESPIGTVPPWNAVYSPGNRYHNNAIQTWSVKADGSIENVYA